MVTLSRYIELDNLNFITRDRSKYFGWNLNGTNFIFNRSFDLGYGVNYWTEIINPEDQYNEHRCMLVSFEHVLKSIPKFIQDNILFNLDLFR